MLLAREYLGTRCEIKSMQNDLLAVGCLLKILDEAVVIGGKEDSSDDIMPLLPYKLKVKIVVFHSKLGTVILTGDIYLSNQKFIRVEQVERLTDFEKRNYFRVNVMVHTSINYKDKDSDEMLSEAVDVRDISLNGISFHTEKKFELGDRLEILMALLNARRFYFKCVIMRSVTDDDKQGRTLYGCFFEEPTEDMTTALCAYLFQQQKIQLTKSKQSAGRTGR